MTIIRSNSILLDKYLGIYKNNPNSKVFAPLGLTYLKLGFVGQALEIIKKGLSIHPNYDLGHFALASYYFHQNNFQSSHKILKGIINSNLDNYLIQNLYGEVCLRIGDKIEAMNAFKYLFFLRPRDKNIYQKLKSLEDEFDVIKSNINNENVKSERLVEISLNLEKNNLIERNKDDLNSKEEQLANNKVQSLNSENIKIEQTNKVKEKSDEFYSLELFQFYVRERKFDLARELILEMIKNSPNDLTLKIKLKELDKSRMPDDKIYQIFLQKINEKSAEYFKSLNAQSH